MFALYGRQNLNTGFIERIILSSLSTGRNHDICLDQETVWKGSFCKVFPTSAIYDFERRRNYFTSTESEGQLNSFIILSFTEANIMKDENRSYAPLRKIIGLARRSK